MAKSSATLIDHIYAPKHLSAGRTVVTNLHLSDHCLVSCETVKCTTGMHQSSSHRLAQYRSTKNIDTQALKRDLACALWDVLNGFDDVEDALYAFEKLFTSVWDLHAPMKSFRHRQKAAPWMTEDINNLRRQRDLKYKIYLYNNKSMDSLLQYKHNHNACNIAVRNAKRKF